MPINSQGWFGFFKKSPPLRWGAAIAGTGLTLGFAGSIAFAYYCYKLCSEGFDEFKGIDEIDLHNVWANISIDNSSFFNFNLSHAVIPLPPFAIEFFHHLADSPEYCFAFSLGFSLFGSSIIALQFATCVCLWKLAREQENRHAPSDDDDDDDEYGPVNQH